MRGFARFHPWLLAFYPAWSLYALNPELIPLAQVIKAVLASLALATALRLLFGRLLRSSGQALLATSFCLLLFFSYGRVDSASQGFGNQALPFLYLLLLGLGLHWIWKRDNEILHLFATTVLLAACLLGGLGLALTQRVPISAADQEAIVETGEGVVDALGYLPDIYFIVLDGYARADVLARYYGFDNSPFLDFLRRCRFFVAEESFANHNRTYLSLASTLNLRPVDNLGEILGQASASRILPYQMIRNSRTSRYLQAKGYTFIQLSSTWGATLENPQADQVLPCGGGIFAREFYRVLADSTALSLFSSAISLDLARCHLRNFQHLEELPARAGPKFVLAHFIPPHHPYLFDRHGNIRRQVSIGNQFDLQSRLWEQRSDYVEQLIYINHRMAQVIGSILRASAQPPIILLISDHGPDLHKIQDEVQRRQVRMANLVSAHLPGQPDLFRHRMSSVNLLRGVFEHYFGAALPPLPDQAFFSPYSQPYAFEDIPLPESTKSPGSGRNGAPSLPVPDADERSDEIAGESPPPVPHRGPDPGR